MTTVDSEFLQVWGQVKQWPLELRQNLAEELAKSVETELPRLVGPWNEVKNARRYELIDKDIQGTLGESEKRELELLTCEMRVHRRRVAPIPMEDATKLHKQLMESKRRHEQRLSEDE